METIRNKRTGKITSYREKVYISGRAVTKSFKRKSDAKAWKVSMQAEAQKNDALGITKKEPITLKDYSELCPKVVDRSLGNSLSVS